MTSGIYTERYSKLGFGQAENPIFESRPVCSFNLTLGQKEIWNHQLLKYTHAGEVTATKAIEILDKVAFWEGAKALLEAVAQVVLFCACTLVAIMLVSFTELSIALLFSLSGFFTMSGLLIVGMYAFMNLEERREISLQTASLAKDFKECLQNAMRRGVIAEETLVTLRP